MADPIIDNVVRAQCIWQGPSALPEDRYVTTWAFVRQATNTSANAAEQSAEVSERLREFWLDPTTAGTAVAALLPDSVTNQGLEIRTYDLGQAPPRQPTITNHPTTLGATGAMLPQEVAICASFYADRNLPRQRGRVYIGPLTVSASATTTNPAVGTGPRTTLIQAMQRLATGEGVADFMDWGVLSGRDAQIRPVTAGWVDDAFDTQRRRGQPATTRTTWPV